MERKRSRPVRQEIMDAFMKLMAEKNYMDITVTDLVKKAGVARASFYRNFQTTNDILEAITDGICKELLEMVVPNPGKRDERKWREFLNNHFTLFLQRRDELANIRVENLSAVFSRLSGRIEKNQSRLPAETVWDRYSAIGKMGLIYSVTRKWMASGAKESPEEMTDYILSFITLF